MFNVEAFRTADLKMREKLVPVPSLPDKFFAEGAKKEFKLRMLTGDELAACAEAVQLAAQTRMLLEKMLSGSSKERIQAVCDASGFGDAIKPETVRKMNIVKYALVDPALPFEDVVRLQQFYPLVFSELANEAIILTGMGADAGE